MPQAIDDNANALSLLRPVLPIWGFVLTYLPIITNLLTVALEIERKFLVRDDSWRTQVTRSVRIRQGYLNQATACSVRVRSASGQGWLNIKSVTIGTKRHEYEYEIPYQEAEEMLDTLCQRPLIEKVRHFVHFGSHLWEVDVFEGDNLGLIVAEIELSYPEEKFAKPSWLGQEVTDDPRYYNICLALKPFKSWRNPPD